MKFPWSKSEYDIAIDKLNRSGYVTESEDMNSVQRNLNGVAFQYLSQEQTRRPVDYTVSDVLRDRPGKIRVNDMKTGKSAVLRLK